jgi:putative ABC transport system ATP-binding protein
MGENVLVRLVDVSKVYRWDGQSTYALRGVTLEIRRGDFVAIMGPSGSGKSTLLNIIGALDKPSSGQVIVNGVDLAKLSGRELAEFRNRFVWFVFQAYNLLGRLTVLENVELPLVRRGIPADTRRRLALRALKSVGISELAFKKPNQLSGGQQQRVAIARAVVTNPLLVLADEPTGNLDSRSGDVVLDLFEKINREQGRTIIVVTHDPRVARRARRIVYVRDGKIVREEVVS